MDDSFKETVRSRVDFPDLVAKSTALRGTANGRTPAMGFCPFHADEKTSSLAVWPDHAHCFGACGRTWDLFGWIMQRDGVEFREALRTAAGMAGLQMPDWTPEAQARAEQRQNKCDVLTAAMEYYHQRLITDRLATESAAQYALERGLTWITIRQARLGYAPADLGEFMEILDRAGVTVEQAIDAGLLRKAPTGGRIYLLFRHRLVIPSAGTTTAAGRCHFFTGRDLTGEARAKWLHLPLGDGESRPVYGSLAGSGPLVLVESPMDALTLGQLGIDAAAVLGTTLPRGSVPLIRRHSPLWIMLDDDPAGRTNAGVIASQIGPRSRIATLPGGDTNDHLQSDGPAATRDLVKQILQEAPSYVEHLAQAIGAAASADQGDAIESFFPVAARLEERDYLILRRRLIDLTGLESRTFNDLMKHYGRQHLDNGFIPTLDGRYQVVSGCICTGGDSPAPLTNFNAQIERVIKLDDGEQVRTQYLISGNTAEGRRLDLAQVPTREYADMTWIDQNWGISAVVAASQQKKVATAIKLLSQGAPSEHVFTHTGWREIEGQRCYLHGDGAIGYTGRTEIQVDLGTELEHYRLPNTPENPVESFQASLRFLEVADPMITYPIWSAIYHAPLGEIMSCRFLIWAYGPTNTRKSTLMLLALQHYGNFEVEGHQTNWSSTANVLERLAFTTKNAAILIDDFNHQPLQYYQRQMEQSAARIIQSTGNETGRMRMARDRSIQQTYRVRSMVLSTGETLPHMAPSAHSRIMPLRFNNDTVDIENLTASQREANVYAHALVGYLLWVREHWDELSQTLPQQHLELRAKMSNRRTARLNDTVCRNYLAASTALRYGQEIGAVSEEQSIYLHEMHWDILNQIAEQQDTEVKSEDPVIRYITLLLDLVEQERAWLVPITNPETAICPIGAEKIGYEDTEHYWLIADAAFGMIQILANKTRQPLTFRRREIQERMWERGILIREQNDRWTCRLTTVKGRPRLLKLKKEKILFLLE